MPRHHLRALCYLLKTIKLKCNAISLTLLPSSTHSQILVAIYISSLTPSSKTRWNSPCIGLKAERKQVRVACVGIYLLGISSQEAFCHVCMFTEVIISWCVRSGNRTKSNSTLPPALPTSDVQKLQARPFQHLGQKLFDFWVLRSNSVHFWFYTFISNGSRYNLQWGFGMLQIYQIGQDTLENNQQF